MVIETKDVYVVLISEMLLTPSKIKQKHVERFACSQVASVIWGCFLFFGFF